MWEFKRNIFKIANDEGSSLLPLLSFYYVGRWNVDDTIHHPEINSWVSYKDAYGITNTFIVGGLENGCQLITASSIIAINGCETCTP